MAVSRIDWKLRIASIHFFPRQKHGRTITWVQEWISVLGRLMVPVFVPLFAVHDGTESRHAVKAAAPPSCCGLLESASDEIFTCSFDLAAPN